MIRVASFIGLAAVLMLVLFLYQLSYSLGWLLYSIGLLVVGVKWKTSKV